jgi:hypothetical protein
MLRDKLLHCQECGVWFVFTRGEQQNFQEKGYLHEPNRCPTCRFLRRKLGSWRSRHR